MTKSINKADEGLEKYISSVEAKLMNFLDSEIKTWSDVDESVVFPLNALKAFVNGGGKRLRPAFCYLGYASNVKSEQNIDEIVMAGCALELLHNFAIIHDDIMDRADTRRGRPTVHRFLEQEYGRDNYVGDIEHFSISVAILTGDFAFTYADKFIRDFPKECLDIYDILKTELFVGQQMDLDAVYKTEITKENISKIARYKSGKYSIERPLHLGAIIADPDVDLNLWSDFGAPLGEAFQLRDDVLGIFGEETDTGKPVGDDLREGKFTLLLAEALERSNSEEKHILEKRGTANLTNIEIDEMAKVIESVGALDAVENRIKDLYDESIIALDKLDLTQDAKACAMYLSNYVCWRNQ